MSSEQFKILSEGDTQASISLENTKLRLSKLEEIARLETCAARVQTEIFPNESLQSLLILATAQVRHLPFQPPKPPMYLYVPPFSDWVNQVQAVKSIGAVCDFGPLDVASEPTFSEIEREFPAVLTDTDVGTQRDRQRFYYQNIRLVEFITHARNSLPIQLAKARAKLFLPPPL